MLVGNEVVRLGCDHGLAEQISVTKDETMPIGAATFGRNALHDQDLDNWTRKFLCGGLLGKERGSGEGKGTRSVTGLENQGKTDENGLTY